MLWILMAVLAAIGALLVMRRRRHYDSARDEPWRASLVEDDDTLDMEEARRAEEEWLAESSWEESVEEDEWG